MRRRRVIGFLLLLSASALLLVSAGSSRGVASARWTRPGFGPASPPRSAAKAHGGMRLPRVMLWAWERPEDLRFLDPRRVGVAFLAGTIEIGEFGEGTSISPDRAVVLRPRLDSLAVPQGTAVMAVVRIETPKDLWRRRGFSREGPGVTPQDSVYSGAQRLRVAGMIASMVRIPGVRAVQVDYDATESELPFYRRLLEGVRRRLPPDMPLSITALASWCLGGEPWLNSLPHGAIDEAVPMLFRMGPGGPGVASFLESGAPFPAPACGGSLGVSTDEAFSQAVLGGALASGAGRVLGRVYVFSSGPWTKAAVDQILTEVDRWDDQSSESR